jgi:hypothetical protein
MKLTQKEATRFYEIINTAVLAGIESIVFQDKTHKAASSRSETCAIITRNEVPEFPQKMGLTRLPVLKKRLDLLINDSSFTIDVKESERGEITQLEMSAGKSKTQYRCTSSANIKAPAAVSDGGMTGLITITKEELGMVLNSAKAMGAEELVLIVKADGTTIFEVTDSNDKFSVEIAKPIERLDDEEHDSAVFYYKPDIFSSILRASIGSSDSVTFAVGVSGTIQLEINNCEMSIFAQIDGGNE